MKFLKWLVPIAVMLISAVSHADLTDVDNKQLREMIDAGVPVIDVRRVDEWQETGVIEGSHLLTFFDSKGRYDAADWLGRVEQIVDLNEPFVLICESGTRSSIIGKWLAKQMDTVHHADGGMSSWMRDKGSVVPHKAK